ncbi:MAG: hypothetical protein H6Q26_1504 [Bacteroidetes bacterium]|nr:hypothetical protein [Bacteroidota bacterium]
MIWRALILSGGERDHIELFGGFCGNCYSLDALVIVTLTFPVAVIPAGTGIVRLVAVFLVIEVDGTAMFPKLTVVA